MGCITVHITGGEAGPGSVIKVHLLYYDDMEKVTHIAVNSGSLFRNKKNLKTIITQRITTLLTVFQWF